MANQRSSIFLDEIFKGIADAVTDIREKVVEEPWHGRSVAERLHWTQEQPSEFADPHREREKDLGMDR